jgi:hypothetical protein
MAKEKVRAVMRFDPIAVIGTFHFQISPKFYQHFFKFFFNFIAPFIHEIGAKIRPSMKFKHDATISQVLVAHFFARNATPALSCLNAARCFFHAQSAGEQS